MPNKTYLWIYHQQVGMKASAGMPGGYRHDVYGGWGADEIGSVDRAHAQPSNPMYRCVCAIR